MKFDIRSQVSRWSLVGKTQLQSVQSAIATSAQSIFRALKLRLSVLTQLSPQSFVLQLIALGAATLMVVLAIGGIQSIAQGTWSAAPEQPQTPKVKPAPPPSVWGKLPTAPPKATTPSPQPSPAKRAAVKPKPLANSPAIPQTKKAAKASPKAISPVPTAVLTQSSLDVFMPPQQSAPADPTNYGNRYAKDVYGKPVYNDPLIVLHETVGSADSAINMFRTPHRNENDQSSYHSIIRRNGTIVYIVPPEKRAFGAGNSIFTGPNGPEAVRTHKQFPPSVNNFAYHISLETPPDGDNDATVHSGYTDAQYRSLAWLIAHTNIPDQRVTTHQAIDQSGSRMDPRSFDAQKFLSILRTLPRPGVKPQASGG